GSNPIALQPLLDDAVIALRAPTQVWSGREGDLGAQTIDGVYHGDVRHIRSMTATCRGSRIEWISVSPDGPSRVVFGGLLRGLDDPMPDPRLRFVRDRRVEAGRVTETWTIESGLPHPVETALALAIAPDFASLH